jgi:hypothetical protein
MAAWTRIGSANVAIHSSGPRFGGDDDGPGAIALGQDLVNVAALDRVHRVEAEVVDDEHVVREQLAELGLVGMIEPGVLEYLE